MAAERLRRCYIRAGFHSGSIAFWCGMFRFSPCRHVPRHLRSLLMEHTDGCSARSTRRCSKLQIRPISPFRHQNKNPHNNSDEWSLKLYVNHEINLSNKKNLKNKYANNVNLSDSIKNFKADNVTIWRLTFLDNFPTHGDIWSTIYQSMWVVVKVIRAILLEVGITLVTLDGISWNKKKPRTIIFLFIRT